MKSLVSATMFATCLLAVSPGGRAQDCNNWTNMHLRGTYTMAGSGWIDLSKLDAGLPTGTVPMSWVGANTMDGKGGGAGWVSLNAGGIQVTIELVNKTYAVKADCSVEESFYMKIKELGKTIGPAYRLVVIGGSPGALELHGIFLGGGPGTPVDLFTARRISMN